MKKRIYSVLVENRSGVLGKVAGLFARRCFNIDSLVVGETDNSDVSCMTIVSSGDERTIEQIEKQLNKKLDVIKVKTFVHRQGADAHQNQIQQGQPPGDHGAVRDYEGPDRGHVQAFHDDPDLRRAGED